MAQALIVSNRLPVSVKKVDGQLEFLPSIGGLATGLSSYVKNRRSSWIGWPGIASDELTEEDKQTITKQLAKYSCRPVFLNKRQVDEYYNGFSNTLLWPTLHGQSPKQTADHERWWKTYREVNALFKETLLSLAKPDSNVWVHDYQLLLLPELLRADHIDGHIGLFLHTPFPEPREFLKIKQARQLLNGMLGADLLGFHTTGYSDNFLHSCRELGLGLVEQGQLILPARSVQVTNFPIGIDYEKYAHANKLPPVKQAAQRYRRRYGRRKIIVAVDRLEPLKGLAERLKAYRDFLAANRRLHGKVIMVMVAAPSRMDIPAYQRLKKRLEKLRDEINDTYGTARWQPLDLIIESLPFEEVSALYQLADVAFIAPLRDGMNLVAKEYVATKRNKGVLILSQTAGAAEELRDALLVDPKQPATVIAALQKALNMPPRELRTRLKRMQAQIAGNTVHTWAGAFIKALQRPLSDLSPQRVRALRGEPLAQLLSDYRQATRRLLLLDYDGTLVPFTEDFRAAKPPKRLLDLLQALQKDSANEIVLVSGRRAADLEAWFGDLQINLVAEHGAAIRKRGAKSWQTTPHPDRGWTQHFIPVLKKYQALTPRADVEVKQHSLVWHYHGSPPYYAQKYAVVLRRVLKPLLKKYGLQLHQGHKILEIRSPEINKGSVTQYWLKATTDFALAIGDDYTDEDLFAGLPDTAYTIKVGSGRTLAGYRLKTTADTTSLLRQLRSAA